MNNEERIAELEAELDACQRLLKLSGSVNRNLMAESEDRYDRLQAAESKLNKSIDQNINLRTLAREAVDKVSAERDELQSKLNEMAQIEPVGFIDANGDAILSVDWLKGGMLYRDQVAQSNADKVEIDKTLVKFLNGEGEFNGLWFGEKKDGENELKPFWWRKYLPSTDI